MRLGPEGAQLRAALHTHTLQATTTPLFPRWIVNRPVIFNENDDPMAPVISVVVGTIQSRARLII
jgi:hypothetical protein